MPESPISAQATASYDRAAKAFDNAVAVLDLPAEGAQLFTEARNNASHRAARTLSRPGPFSVVLMAILAGTDIRDHSVHGAAVVQVLEGEAHFEIGQVALDIAAGSAITIRTGVEHRLSVPDDTLLLLTIAAS